MQKAVRRSFAKSFEGLGSRAAFLAHPLGAATKLAETLHIGDRRHKFSATRFLMGTQVSIVALHLSKDAAEKAVALAFNEIERLSAIFDRHRSGSPVSQLNETGRLCDVAPELFEVMVKAKSYCHRSGGAFDSSVLPVLEMMQNNCDSKGQVKLNQSDFDDALALVGSDMIHVSESEISFDRRFMAVTLDGIGRGYIVDRASDILVDNGIENHLICAGGDIRARGERAPGQSWLVPIDKPSSQGGYSAVIKLKDSAVATSYGSEFYFDAEGYRQDEAIPKTVFAPHVGAGLSVVAPSVMEADALSTSAFVMNFESGLRFINEQKKSECLISGLSGAKMFSRNWDALVGI
ncbi:FAD:protein FMN transferase [Maridesulfovibrio sp.]|uniref:FAD:protein FMN transferase n=1 Tax=Maridesulfovibrio sp. TaxID=2795000 RepID=UPI0029CA2FCE|nr:FAD:protein FMN transferase [Maridesulfovibrio sp.]